jgi:hypothetical protein
VVWIIEADQVTKRVLKSRMDWLVYIQSNSLSIFSPC